MGEQPEAGGTAGGGAAAVLPASEKQQLDSEGEGEEEPLLLERRYGTTGFAHASAFSKTTYTFVSPLLALGAKEQVRRLKACLPSIFTQCVCTCPAACGPRTCPRMSAHHPGTPARLARTARMDTCQWQTQQRCCRRALMPCLLA